MRYRCGVLFSFCLLYTSYAEDYTDAEIKAIFNKVYGGTVLTKEEILKFKSAMLVAFEMCIRDRKEKGQFFSFFFSPIRLVFL